MEFIKGNLVILNEEGKKMFKEREDTSKGNQVHKIINANTFSAILWVHDAFKDEIQYPVSRKYHRLATESEIKAYKIKSLFEHKGLN